jgi:predicted phage tail protein
MRIDTPKGSKGGSSSSPTQASDSLSSVTYAKILDLISEGPIFGPATGTNPAQSVYLNNVPLQNPDGSNNFVVDGFDFRYGEIDQTYIPGFDNSSQETSIGVEFKQVTPWNVTVTDLDVNAIVITLGVSSLSQTNSSTGDVTGYEVDYQIQLSTDGGAYAVVVNTSFNGKASSTYERSHRVALSGATSQYALRVVRTTPDTTSVFISDTTTVVSYAEVIDAKLRYPLSSVCAISVDAVQFSSLPTRSYDMKGLLIKYPSNYNPATRAYVGTWDGTFVTGWTDNPAWIFYDLVLNNRYGLGQWVDASMVDRFALYIIAQYCDVMVSDGMGGQEPR